MTPTAALTPGLTVPIDSVCGRTNCEVAPTRLAVFGDALVFLCAGHACEWDDRWLAEP